MDIKIGNYLVAYYYNSRLYSLTTVCAETRKVPTAARILLPHLQCTNLMALCLVAHLGLVVI
jgi:hypothetical protein